MQKFSVKYGIVLILLLLSVPASAQLSSVSGTWNLRPLDWNTNRWEFSVGTLFSQSWGENLGQSYLRMNIGLMASLKAQYLQEPQLFAQLSLGWEWNLSIQLTRHIRMSGFSHEISLKMKDIGGKPNWVVEFLPFAIAFDIEGWFEQAESTLENPLSKPMPFGLPKLNIPPLAVPENTEVFPDQQVSLDLKALVLSRLDDLMKAGEELAKGKPMLDPVTFREPLTEAKKAFDAGKISDAVVQLNSYSMVLRALRKFLPDVITEFDEAYLRSGFHRLADALAVYTERTQNKATKVCTGLYINADKKEEVIGQFLNEVPKTASFGAKGTLTLKESKCF